MKSSKYLEDSDKSTKRSTKSSSSGRVKKKKSKKENKINRKSEEESVESKELYLSLKYKDNMEKCLSYLESYLNGLNLTDLNKSLHIGQFHCILFGSTMFLHFLFIHCN